ncbi:MAG: recombinase family protein [Blautia sp.]|nr:recombinase family protein [Blautia sp.]
MVIGIYPRKSVYRDNSDSVQVQVQMCKDYAGIIYKGRDLDFRIYDKDEGFSGKNTNRPSFRELMQDVEDGMLDVVMVYKLDRISRNVQEFSAMYGIFQQHDVAFVSVKESFDTATPMGRTVMYILAAFAQLERENTSERVADNMLALGSSGKWTGGNLPTGFSSIRRKAGGKEHSFLVVDKDSIGLVKTLYSLILSGCTITKAERYCRDNNIRSHAGNFLGSSQIHNILKNPVYCQNSLEAYYYLREKGCTLPDKALFDGTKSLIGYGRTRTTASSHKAQGTDSWVISIGIHEPVISASDWIAAQQRLGINRSLRTAKHEHGILKGVLRCRCGSRMDIRTYVKNGISFSYYYCARMARQGKQACGTGYIRIEEVEASFLQQLRSIRLNPSGIALRSQPEETMDKRSIQAGIQKAEASIRNLTTALTQAMDTPAAGYIIKQITDLDAQKSALEASLRKIEVQALAAKSLEDTEREIYSSICYLLDNFDNISYTGKNELIRKTVKNCILDTETKELRIIF